MRSDFLAAWRVGSAKKSMKTVGFHCQSLVEASGHTQLAWRWVIDLHYTMIGHITGSVLFKDERVIIVRVAGVGYTLSVTPATASRVCEPLDTAFFAEPGLLALCEASRGLLNLFYRLFLL